jgi:hypothetical protein
MRAAVVAALTPDPQTAPQVPAPMVAAQVQTLAALVALARTVVAAAVPRVA